MELSSFLLLNIDGAGSKHLFGVDELRLFYGATGSGKSTLLKGISRAVRTSQGVLSPTLLERGVSSESRCASLFKCNPGPLLEFDQLLDDAILAREKNLPVEGGALGSKSLWRSPSLWNGFPGLPTRPSRNSENDENIEKDIERPEIATTEIDSINRLENVFKPYQVKLEPGKRWHEEDTGPRFGPLADWALVACVFASPEFRGRVQNIYSFDMGQLSMQEERMLAYEDIPNRLESALSFEENDWANGFIAEWNKFRIESWFGWRIDDPLDKSPVSHGSLDLVDVANQIDVSEFRVFGEALLKEILCNGFLATIEGRGVNRGAELSDRFAEHSLIPQLDFLVKFDDLSLSMQEQVRDFGPDEELAGRSPLMNDVIRLFQQKPDNYFINLTSLLDKRDYWEADSGWGPREGLLEFSRSVSDLNSLWDFEVRVLDTTDFDLVKLSKKLEAGVSELHDRMFRDAYRSLCDKRSLYADWPIIELPKGTLPIGDSSLDRWLIRTKDQTGFRSRPTLDVVANQITERANKFPPSFIADYKSNPTNPAMGRILIEIKSVDLWQQSDAGSRVFVGLEREGQLTELKNLSSGEQRWVAMQVFLAIETLNSRDYLMDKDWFPSNPSGNQMGAGETDAYENEVLATLTNLREGHILPKLRHSDASIVLLLDEPELHLDEAKRFEVADWLYERINARSKVDKLSIFAATHSTEILTRHPAHRANQTAVMMLQGGVIDASYIGDELVSWLAEFGVHLGTAKDIEFRAALGFLIVEGEHDETVIKHFFATELEQARIQIIRLQGTYQKDAIAQSLMLEKLGKPVYTFFDRIYQPSDRKTSPEMNVGKYIKRALKEKKVPCEYGGHKFPDIIAALPEDAVRRAFPDCKFTSWADLIAAHPGPKFKEFVQDDMGWPTYENSNKTISTTEFIKRVLKACRENERPQGALIQGIKAATAFISDKSNQSRNYS
jgi:energy-coupling factor transporter ATP-binding protein EcfA2